MTTGVIPYAGTDPNKDLTSSTNLQYDSSNNALRIEGSGAIALTGVSTPAGIAGTATVFADSSNRASFLSATGHAAIQDTTGLTADRIYTWPDSAGTIALSGSSGTGINKAVIFGTGGDGSATISVNTSLTADMYYQNLTINSGVTLATQGFIVWVAGTLTVNGTLSANAAAQNGSNGLVNAGGAGGTLLPTNTTIGGVGAGGAGGVNAGNTTGGSSGCVGQKGGNGGAGAGVAGSAGNATQATTGGGTKRIFYNMNPFNHPLCGVNSGSSALTVFVGGTGGGGGGGNNNSTTGGGGGGAGGGACLVYANIITGTGTIHANGGNGGDGYAVSGNNGGGGGGGGGVLIVFSTTPSAVAAGVTATANGGTGGTGHGGGANGSNGTNGNVLWVAI